MDTLINGLYMVARYLHIVCTTLLVGGTLFYEMVVPIAIEDLKEEHQLSIFARARWVFRRIVWVAAITLIATGVISSAGHWAKYTASQAIRLPAPTTSTTQVSVESASPRSGWWWAAHASTGGLAVLIALFLTLGKRPPDHPIQWMRLNLVILLIVIFLATATRQVRINETDRNPARHQQPTGG